VQRGEMPEGKLGDATATQPIGGHLPGSSVGGPKTNQPKPLEITASVPAVSPPTSTQTGESRFWQIATGVGIMCTAIISLVALMYSLKDKDSKDGAVPPVVAVNDGNKAQPGPGKGKDLTEEDYKALQEMMTQQPKGRRYPNAGKEHPDPMRPLEPIENPLKPGPLPAMLAEAEAYAKANPTNYRSIIARYEQLYDLTGGTPMRPTVGDARKMWLDRQMVAVRKEYETLANEARRIIAEQGHRVGMQVWAKFPDELRGGAPDQFMRTRIEQDFPPPTPGSESFKNKGPRDQGPPP
jgi:hypothetical protein